MAPDPPNLKGTALMREDRYPKAVDLHKLDGFDTRDKPATPE